MDVKREDDVFALGEVFARSGYFTDARDAAQATVKILAGREIGIPPFAAMTGIHLIKGKLALGANLIAAKIKASGKYNYRVAEMSDAVCRVLFFEAGEQIGVSEFTLQDARKAGTQNLDKFPRNMLFARAISNGARWYCPDLFTSAIYTPEELGAGLDVDGDVVELSQTPPQLPEPVRAAASITPKMLERIEQLGGDVDTARTMTYDEIVAYGKSLKEKVPTEPAPTPTVAEAATLIGKIINPVMTEDIITFTIESEEKGRIGAELWVRYHGNPQVTQPATQLCRRKSDGDWEWNPESEGAVWRFAGKWETCDPYGDSFVVEHVSMLSNEGDA